jgi:hypothetical protein
MHICVRREKRGKEKKWINYYAELLAQVREHKGVHCMHMCEERKRGKGKGGAHIIYYILKYILYYI